MFAQIMFPPLFITNFFVELILELLRAQRESFDVDAFELWLILSETIFREILLSNAEASKAAYTPLEYLISRLVSLSLSLSPTRIHTHTQTLSLSLSLLVDSNAFLHCLICGPGWHLLRDGWSPGNYDDCSLDGYRWIGRYLVVELFLQSCHVSLV